MIITVVTPMKLLIFVKEDTLDGDRSVSSPAWELPVSINGSGFGGFVVEGLNVWNTNVQPGGNCGRRSAN